VVGLSGNLGFTHDPDVVFDAALLLQHDPASISCSQVGEAVSNASRQGKSRQPLPTLRWSNGCPKKGLRNFFRPLLIISEPDAEAALTVKEDRLGWVVTPGDTRELAATTKIASGEEIRLKGARAAEKAVQFSEGSAMTKYQSLVEMLFKKKRGDLV
jgi:colanic acid biosynthesis glycosyl transferase WcaI